MIQLRFINCDQKNTFRVYELTNQSLGSYRPKNRYGFVNFPPDESRCKDQEIAGSDDLESAEN